MYIPEYAHHYRSMTGSRGNPDPSEPTAEATDPQGRRNRCTCLVLPIVHVRAHEKNPLRWSIPCHPVLGHAADRVGRLGHAVLFTVTATDASITCLTYAFGTKTVFTVTKECANRGTVPHKASGRSIAWPNDRAKKHSHQTASRPARRPIQEVDKALRLCHRLRAF